MRRGFITRIVIRRPDGKTEIVGRSGHLDPHQASREFATVGTVLAVRHEQVAPKAPQATTQAIHRVG